MTSNKVLLMILDGWGIGDGSRSDVISAANPEFINNLQAKFPSARLLTCGEHVGLPDGQMGNSEVGHLNIGAGRIVYQDLVKINRSCRDGSLANNPELVSAIEYARDNGRNVHIMGLVSDGGVHSSLEHLLRLCDVATGFGLERVYIHSFMDGRDTDPKSGAGYLRQVRDHISGGPVKMASVVGRYYAMDRDKRWERVKKAYDLLVHAKGKFADDVIQAVEASYAEGITDEFIEPIVAVDKDGNPVATISSGDVVIFFNFRNDRAKELTIALTQKDMPEQEMYTVPLYYCTMTPYDATFEGMHVLFGKDNVENTIGEYIASKGLSQLRIAETEKYAHVTFFLNGGREAEFPGEERILINSPKVATYDLQPEMSAYEVKAALVDALDTQKFDFIALNFANGDMVGHTGIYDSIFRAIQAVDENVKDVVTAARANGYEVVVIADHGNADNAVNPDGSPNTAHSLNPVPIIVVSDRVKAVRDGVLADVAPTVLDMMGLEKPDEMTGISLVELK